MSFAEFAERFTNLVWSEPVAYLLTGAGLLFTLMTFGIQFKALTHGYQVIRGKYDNPEDEGNISHFQALCAALSATIGLGNISGVAVAVATGGAGAVFWMWMVGFLGMATKFTTCSLGIMYRKQDSFGTYRGGPMYYIELGLGRRWKPLAVLFAFLGTCACLGAGNMFQSNQVSMIIRDTVYEFFRAQGTGLEKSTQDYIQYGVGVVMCFLAGLVIIGGIKRIGAVAGRIVPLMCVIYVCGALTVIILNVTEVPALLLSIFKDAFTGSAAEGAFFGVVVKTALITGVKRACFSNEAGLGSAPMAHATAKTNEPIREGVVAAVGPFIDTIVICTMTALVILITQSHARQPVGTVTEVIDTRAVEGGAEIDVRLEFQVPEYAETGVQLTLAPLESSGSDTPTHNVAVTRKVGERSAVVTVAVADAGAPRASIDVDQYPALAPGSRVFLHKEGISLTAYAFDQVIPGFGTWFLPIAAFLFAFSTIISWGFYGETCIEYLLGEAAVKPFKFLYCGMVIVGVLALELKPVLDFSDAMLGLMLVPNLIATILLAPRVMRASRSYFSRLAAGEFEDEVRRAAEAKARSRGS